jgi:hypothetical protein
MFRGPAATLLTLGSILIPALLTDSQVSIAQPLETTASTTGYQVTYLRDSAALFPLTSIIRELDHGMAVTKLSRDPKAPDTLAMALPYSEDRTATAMRSQLMITEDLTPDGNWSVVMVALDGSTTTSATFDGSQTQITTLIKGLRFGDPVLTDIQVLPGNHLPVECLSLWDFRPNRFTGLVSDGSAGCPLTAVYSYEKNSETTATLLADLGTASLMSSTDFYSTGSLKTEVFRETRADYPQHWPTKIIQKRLEPDGSTAQVTTYSILRMAIRESVSLDSTTN